MARRTKIVATIGPASREPEVLARMIEAGLDVARFNFSHGSRELHAENAERVRAASEAVGRPVAILQDLPGPKLRIGVLRDGIAELKPGEKLRLACGSTDEGDATRISVSWPGLLESKSSQKRPCSSAARLRLATINSLTSWRNKSLRSRECWPPASILDCRPVPL